MAPSADEQEQLCVRGLARSPVFELVRTSDLYASVTYQPLLKGSASGVVWIIRAGGDTETLPRNAICLCEEIPNELPPVRALVTNALQMQCTRQADEAAAHDDRLAGGHDADSVAGRRRDLVAPSRAPLMLFANDKKARKILIKSCY